MAYSAKKSQGKQATGCEQHYSLKQTCWYLRQHDYRDDNRCHRQRPEGPCEPKRLRRKRGCNRTMPSVPAPAATASSKATTDPAENGIEIGEPRARKVTSVVGMSSTKLNAMPKTRIQVAILIRSR